MLERLESMGFVKEASPVSALPALAKELGLQQLSIKRDDLLPGLLGGTKVRKLDYLLASEPFRSSTGVHGIGAIGSGLLAALAVACRAQGKKLVAHTFAESVDPYVLDNLAVMASYSERVVFYRSRVQLGVFGSALFRKPIVDGYAVVPPGATNAAGMVGAVRAGLELGEQVKQGVLAQPDVIYVALGSMGTVAGLSVGLALANLRAKIVAVSAIEKTFSKEAALQRHVQSVCAHLTAKGVSGVSALRPVPVQIVRSELGRGYGVPTDASLEACRRAAAHGLALEPVYGGKAFASLMAAGPQRHVLFWQTRRGAGPAVLGDWQTRLPGSLRTLVA